MYSDLLFDYLENIYIESGKDCGANDKLSLLGITRDKYEIVSEKESLKYGKPKGNYELIGINNVLFYSDEEIKECIKVVSKAFRDMIGEVNSADRILVVGLGNRHISPDSLGAKVVGNINVTFENKKLPKVMAVCTSVMGLTGIETVEIIKGIALRVNPTHIILIDSLCASSVARLGRSIQITNTGICPGGGIGNNRKCIGEDIAKNVYSIGVPLLIYASTFIKETFEKNGLSANVIDDIMQECEKHCKEGKIYNVLNSLKSVISEDVDDMIVSVKDIEECVDILSVIISESINNALGISL